MSVAAVIAVIAIVFGPTLASQIMVAMGDEPEVIELPATGTGPGPQTAQVEPEPEPGVEPEPDTYPEPQAEPEAEPQAEMPQG